MGEGEGGGKTRETEQRRGGEMSERGERERVGTRRMLI
jgi:hypothetical protein